jgi:hypothetical protein
MALPEPEPGLVFRYNYLWSREAKRGRVASKERPACLAMATDSDIEPRAILILPITHSKPVEGDIGVEIPANVRRSLGLDDQRCWVIVSDSNVDEWPSPDILPLPRNPRVFAYGVLPPRLFDKIKTEFLRHYDKRRSVRR